MNISEAIRKGNLIKNIQQSKNSLSIEDYLKKYPTPCLSYHGAEYYLKYGIVDEGLLKWDINHSPERWAGIWPGSYVHYTLKDHSKGDLALKTQVQLFEELKHYERHLSSNYDSVKRLGITPVKGSFGLDDDQVKLLWEQMTPDEKMVAELSIARSISYEDRSPFKRPSVEYPYQLHLAGTDDCSFSLYWGKKGGAIDIFEDICLEDRARPDYKPSEELELLFFFENPNWHKIETLGFIFTN